MFGTVSIASRRQSSRPIEASENRPSPGAVSFARATLIFAARSGPNHGLARAPFTALRVVATSSVGLVVSSAASKRAPVPAIHAHPSSANTDAVHASTRTTLRRASSRVVPALSHSRRNGAGIKGQTALARAPGGIDVKSNDVLRAGHRCRATRNYFVDGSPLT